MTESNLNLSNQPDPAEIAAAEKQKKEQLDNADFKSYLKNRRGYNDSEISDLAQDTPETIAGLFREFELWEEGKKEKEAENEALKKEIEVLKLDALKQQKEAQQKIDAEKANAEALQRKAEALEKKEQERIKADADAAAIENAIEAEAKKLSYEKDWGTYLLTHFKAGGTKLEEAEQKKKLFEALKIKKEQESDAFINKQFDEDGKEYAKLNAGAKENIKRFFADFGLDIEGKVTTIEDKKKFNETFQAWKKYFEDVTKIGDRLKKVSEKAARIEVLMNKTPRTRREELEFETLKLDTTLYIHGGRKTKDGVVPIEPDLDAKSAAYILGFSVPFYQTVFLEPGDKGVTGGIHADVSGTNLTFKEEGEGVSTVSIDHHGPGKAADTSATELAYEVLEANGMLGNDNVNPDEKTKNLKERWVKNYVEFVTKIDNASFDIAKDDLRKDGKWGYTLYSLFAKKETPPFEICRDLIAQGLDPDQDIRALAKLKKKFKNPLNPTEDFSLDIKIPGKSKKEKKKGGEEVSVPLTLEDICRGEHQHAINASKNAPRMVEAMKKFGIKTESPKLGKVLMNNFGEKDKTKPDHVPYIAKGFNFARGLGYETWISFDDEREGKHFMISSSKKNLDLHKIFEKLEPHFPGIKEIRGDMLIWNRKEGETKPVATPEMIAYLLDLGPKPEEKPEEKKEDAAAAGVGQQTTESAKDEFSPLFNVAEALGIPGFTEELRLKYTDPNNPPSEEQIQAMYIEWVQSEKTQIMVSKVMKDHLSVVLGIEPNSEIKKQIQKFFSKPENVGEVKTLLKEVARFEELRIEKRKAESPYQEMRRRFADSVELTIEKLEKRIEALELLKKAEKQKSTPSEKSPGIWGYLGGKKTAQPIDTEAALKFLRSEGIRTQSGPELDRAISMRQELLIEAKGSQRSIEDFSAKNAEFHDLKIKIFQEYEFSQEIAKIAKEMAIKKIRKPLEGKNFEEMKLAQEYIADFAHTQKDKTNLQIFEESELEKLQEEVDQKIEIRVKEEIEKIVLDKALSNSFLTLQKAIIEKFGNEKQIGGKIGKPSIKIFLTETLKPIRTEIELKDKNDYRLVFIDRLLKQLTP